MFKAFENFDWQRLWAMIVKEFIQMKRDRGTFAMIIALPIIQIILFGFAINNNPKQLATAIVTSDNTEFTRRLIQGLENTGYFKINKRITNYAEGNRLLQTGEVLFVLNIPPNFTHDLIRGNNPSVLLESDATDPTSIGNANGAAQALPQTIFQRQLDGSLSYLNPTNPPFQMLIHEKYNPARITQYNIVPGLLGVVLTMTMTMITGIAITRERERGTMENLLATPVQPLEVMIGKVTPFIMVGYIQACLILILAWGIFNVPMRGSIILLLFCALPFIAANLAVGLTLSTIAQNQLQAVQMTTFFFLPSILLSGFMFPFYGMPLWAQWLGNLLPLTHFIRIARGILLKGNGLPEIYPDLWPLLLFLILIIAFGVTRYKQTLD